MKLSRRPPDRPLDKYSLDDALDRATSHLVRAAYQFHIPGGRRKDHWQRAYDHLIETRGALEEAIAILAALLVLIYPPTDAPP